MNTALYYLLAEIEDTHWWNVSRRHLVEAVLSRHDISGCAEGLDIGCGTGGNLGLLERFCSNVTGLDFSDVALELAKKRHPENNFVYGDANRLSDIFEPESFGLVTIFNVLCHKWISSELDVLKQTYSILKPGGALVVTEPAFNILMRKHDIQAMGVRRYRLGLFKKMLKSAGFELVYGTYFNSISFLPALLSAALDSIRGIDYEALKETSAVKELVANNTINRLMIALMGIETKIISLFGNIPLGVTLLCVARKQSAARKPL